MPQRNRPQPNNQFPGIPSNMMPPTFNDAALEAELLGLVAEDQPKPKPNRPPAPKNQNNNSDMPANLPFSWDEINNQVSQALDGGENMDFDEDDLMGELGDLCEGQEEEEQMEVETSNSNNFQEIKQNLEQIINHKKSEAVKFNRTGDKAQAAFHLRIMKQAEQYLNGDLSKVNDMTLIELSSQEYQKPAVNTSNPTSPQAPLRTVSSTTLPVSADTSKTSVNISPKSGSNQAAAWKPDQKTSPPPTNDLVTALGYRIQKFEYDIANCDSAAKKRRLTRTLASHQDCLKKFRLGRPVNLEILPQLDGYPLPSPQSGATPVSQPKPTLAPQPQIPGNSAPVNLEDQYKTLINEIKQAKANGDTQTAVAKLQQAKQLKAKIDQKTTQIIQSNPVIPPVVNSNPVPTPPPKPQAISDNNDKPWTITSGLPPPKTDDVATALSYQVQKYKFEMEKATKEGNSSKSRRMKRQFDTVNSLFLKAKKGVVISQTSLDALPLIHGWPPLPKSGGGSTSQSQATNQPVQPITASTSQTSNISQTPQSQPQPNTFPTSNSNPALMQKIIKDHQNQTTSNKLPADINKYESTCQLLKSRSLEFKQAAKMAKDNNDREKALQYLKSCKRLEEMLKIAEEGKRVDVTVIPPTPECVLNRQSMQATSTSTGSRSIANNLQRNLSVNETEIYDRLLHKYEQQIALCSKMSQQFLSTGKVQKSAIYDQVKKFSIQEKDIIYQMMKKRQRSPTAYISSQTIIMAQMNADLQPDQIRVSIRHANLVFGKKEMEDLSKKGFYFIFKVPLHNKPEVDTADKTESYNDFQKVNKSHISKTMNHLQRKSRTVERSIQGRTVTLEIWENGSWMRSDKKIATSNHPMKEIMSKCMIDVPGQFVGEGGRKIIGKSVVRIEVATPIKSSDEKAIPMEFVCLEQNKDRFLKFFMTGNSQDGKSAAISNQVAGSSAAKIGRSTNGMPNLRSVKVILFENTINQAQIKHYQDNKKVVPERLTQLKTKLQKEYHLTSSWIEKSKQPGKDDMMNHYLTCVRQSLDQYTNEYESLLSLGARDVETKKAQQRIEQVKLELQQYGQSTYI